MNSLKRGIFLATVLSFCLTTNLHALELKLGPYVQLTTQKSTVLRWETDEKVDSRVRYGTSLENLNQKIINRDKTKFHRLTVNGLTAGTRYYYAVGSTSKDFNKP